MKSLLYLLILLVVMGGNAFAKECNSGMTLLEIPADETVCWADFIMIQEYENGPWVSPLVFEPENKRFIFKRHVRFTFPCEGNNVCTNLDFPEGTTVEIE